MKNKELLIKDICARLPYGVKVNINSPIDEQNSMELFDVNLDSEHIGVGNEKWAFRAIPVIDDEDESKVIKPYLRPMSSMTEEEIETLWSIWENDAASEAASKMTDFLNKKYLDHHHLIDKGLAIEASEGMYEI